MSKDSQLGNLSTRLSVGINDNVLIGGLIISGTSAKKIITRAIGPSLEIFGELDDPALELYDSAGKLLAANDNWKDDPVQEREIELSGVPPKNDKESAIVMTFAPGPYTAIVRGVAASTGIALIEFYDLDTSSVAKLANISTRGLVQTGDDVLIGGTIVLGQVPANVIVRAIGPSLPVPNPLLDPTLELHDETGAVIASNDDWRSDQEAEIVASTVPPPDAAESAIVAALAPGGYTFIVRGANGTTGVALVECYQLP